MRSRPHGFRTTIAILHSAVETWRHRERWGRSTVCDEIVKAHQRNGWDEDTGIFFEPNPDEYRRQQTNAERIYRWLDDESKASNLMPPNFQRSILAALPQDLRIAAADELLGGTGLVCRLSEPIETYGFQTAVLVANVAKESIEAVAAVADLVADGSRDKLRTAQRELTEAVAASTAALLAVESELSKSGSGD